MISISKSIRVVLKADKIPISINPLTKNPTTKNKYKRTSPNLANKSFLKYLIRCNRIHAAVSTTNNKSKTNLITSIVY